VGDLPHVAVWVSKGSGRTAPVSVTGGTDNGAAGSLRLGQNDIDLLRGADIVRQLDPRCAMTPESRPESEHHPAGLEEADLVIGLLSTSPSQRLVEPTGPGQIVNAESDKADTLLHSRHLDASGKVAQDVPSLFSLSARRQPVRAGTSLIYRSAPIYELVMRVLYGRYYTARMRVVAEQVPRGASVLELCCGPGTLYFRYLRDRAAGYVGLDVNSHFVARLRRRGVDARVLDLTSDAEPLPASDVVLMQASLYHFLPDAGRIVDRMLAAARKLVIISEPIRNLTSSTVPGVALIGRRAADPGVGGHAERFTEATLDQLMEDHRWPAVSVFTIPGGREKVYVLSAKGSSDRRELTDWPASDGSVGN
jgi:SAM-dependent methyltransferase